MHSGLESFVRYCLSCLTLIKSSGPLAQQHMKERVKISVERNTM